MLAAPWPRLLQDHVHEAFCAFSIIHKAQLVDGVSSLEWRQGDSRLRGDHVWQGKSSWCYSCVNLCCCFVCVCGREREGVAALPFSFVWIVDVANRQMGPVPKCAFESLLWAILRISTFQPRFDGFLPSKPKESECHRSSQARHSAICAMKVWPRVQEGSSKGQSQSYQISELGLQRANYKLSLWHPLTNNFRKDLYCLPLSATGRSKQAGKATTVWKNIKRHAIRNASGRNSVALAAKNIPDGIRRALRLHQTLRSRLRTRLYQRMPGSSFCPQGQAWKVILFTEQPLFYWIYTTNRKG